MKGMTKTQFHEAYLSVLRFEKFYGFKWNPTNPDQMRSMAQERIREIRTIRRQDFEKRNRAKLRGGRYVNWQNFYTNLQRWIDRNQPSWPNSPAAIAEFPRSQKSVLTRQSKKDQVTLVGFRALPTHFWDNANCVRIDLPQGTGINF